MVTSTPTRSKSQYDTASTSTSEADAEDDGDQEVRLSPEKDLALATLDNVIQEAEESMNSSEFEVKQDLHEVNNDVDDEDDEDEVMEDARESVTSSDELARSASKASSSQKSEAAASSASGGSAEVTTSRPHDDLEIIDLEEDAESSKANNKEATIGSTSPNPDSAESVQEEEEEDDESVTSFPPPPTSKSKTNGEVVVVGADTTLVSPEPEADEFGTPSPDMSHVSVVVVGGKGENDIQVIDSSLSSGGEGKLSASQRSGSSASHSSSSAASAASSSRNSSNQNNIVPPPQSYQEQQQNSINLDGITVGESDTDESKLSRPRQQQQQQQGVMNGHLHHQHQHPQQDSEEDDSGVLVMSKSIDDIAQEDDLPVDNKPISKGSPVKKSNKANNNMGETGDQQQQQNNHFVRRNQRAVSEDVGQIRAKAAAKDRLFDEDPKHHHPSHEEEVVLRKKRQEQQRQLEAAAAAEASGKAIEDEPAEAPIVPVLRGSSSSGTGATPTKDHGVGPEVIGGSVVRKTPLTKEDIAKMNLKKKTRKRTRKFEIDGVVVTTTTSKVIYGDDENQTYYDEHYFRKQELRELKLLQKQEQKQFQDLAFKNQLCKEQQDKRFEQERTILVKNYENDLQSMMDQQKKQVDKAEEQQHVDLKVTSKKIRAEQEKDMKAFRESLKQELKLLKQESELLPKDRRKEQYKARKEALEQDQQHREQLFLTKLNDTHESSLKRLSDTHKEKIALLDRQFLQQKQQLMRAREAAIWEMEERQLHERNQLAKRQLKDLFFLQRHQMLVHHEKELEHLKRMMDRKEEDLVKNQTLERKQLPKRIRQEMKAREMMFRESMRISTTNLNEVLKPTEEKDRLKKVRQQFSPLSWMTRNVYICHFSSKRLRRNGIGPNSTGSTRSNSGIWKRPGRPPRPPSESLKIFKTRRERCSWSTRRPSSESWTTPTRRSCANGRDNSSPGSR